MRRPLLLIGVGALMVFAWITFLTIVRSNGPKLEQTFLDLPGYVGLLLIAAGVALGITRSLRAVVGRVRGC